MKESTISAPSGFFALVSYVPDPLGSLLDRMTQALSGVAFRKAHITILPPRPLRVPLEEMTRYVRSVLDQFEAFDVQLNAVRRFPVTNVVYLDLTEGTEPVHRLHTALNSGELAFDEPFDFHPHLTLVGPAAGDHAEEVQARAERFWQAIEPKGPFQVREIVALHAQAAKEVLVWRRIWAHPLRDSGKKAYFSTTGRTS